MAQQFSYPERYPLNQGDFYSENGSCTACGAPQAEAPVLIEHSREDHCYFRKQPVTGAEVDQAIRAMMVSCTNALRYGGTDEQILKRLYENGMADLCDRQPQQHYPVVVRNRVDFTYTGTLHELVRNLTNYLLGINMHFTIADEVIYPSGQFRFIKRWYPKIPGTVYEGRQEGPQKMSITVRRERGVAGGVGTSYFLHDFLQQRLQASHVQWRSEDPGNMTVYEKPF